MNTVRRRGVEMIRDYASLAGDAHSPHRRYLKVASLELRKSLCNTVRLAARQRVAEMDRQLAAIEAEQAQLLQIAPARALGEAEPGDDERPAGPPPSPSRRGLTIKY